MVVPLVDEPDILAAWLDAAAKLAMPGENPPFLVITAGSGFSATRVQLKTLDDAAVAVGAERPGTVAEVLMPDRVMRNTGGVASSLDAGWRLFGRGRGRKLKFSGWAHTYFERLTGRWMKGDLVLHEIKENRIASIIEKIRLWNKDVEGALYAHTDLPSDTLRVRGSPCLQYVQFRLFAQNRLEMFAVYRSHDYFNKALGNLIGLQRLGQFVAKSTGRTFVRQTVFSLHPISGGTKASLKEFVDRVRQQQDV